MQTYWIYYAGDVVTCVLLPANATEGEIRRKAALHSYIFCNAPFEAPFEFELKCRHGEIRL